MDRARFAEIVDFAIGKEEEAAAGYAMASEMVTKPHVKRMLEGLARQEEGHKRKLENLEIGKVQQASIQAVPDLKLSDYSDDVSIGPDMDYQQVLLVAMKREQKAHDLYTTLASNATEPGMKKVFSFMAEEEARHKLALEKEYDDRILTDN